MKKCDTAAKFCFAAKLACDIIYRNMSTRLEKLIQTAKDSGFDQVGVLNVEAIVFDPRVRDMCAAGKCGKYGKSWMCPPGCGSLEEMAERVKEFTEGVIVQSVAQMEDEFDFEAMQDAQVRQKESFMKLSDRLHEEHVHCLMMGCGTCTICKECTYPDAPCRFPDRAMPSMEACGLLVSQVCTDSGVKYYYGPNTIAYTSCVMI